MPWLRVIWLGTLGVVLAKIAALFVVPFLNKEQRKNHPWFGNSWTNDYSYWNMAVRNGAHNLFRIPMPEYTTKANTEDLTLEKEAGWQWRYRRSTGDGKYVSFRCTWGKPRKSKGKREFYVGWTMRPSFEDNTASLTFFQFRPL